MRTYYIYKYTNLIDDNNKIYVGQCFDLAQRRRAHKSAALNNSEACPLFYRAIRKYGYENFNFEIIEEIYTDQEGIDEKEIYWIRELNSRDNEIGYNISIGGGGRANPNNTDMHKQCPRCDKIKSRDDDYTKSSYTHDGNCFCCRECYIKIENEYRASLSDEEKERRNKVRRNKYAENPQIQIEASKKYYEDHKEERAEYKKEYYLDNIEKLTEINRNYRDTHREEISKQSKEARQLIKKENSKLTSNEICLRTPMKFCHGICQKNIESINFYIDLSKLDGLGRNCKDCHKIKMAIVRERNRNKAKAAE